MSNTKPVGVRVPIQLLDRAKAVNPNFNLSKYVRQCLSSDYGDVEECVDALLEKFEDMKRARNNPVN